MSWVAWIRATVKAASAVTMKSAIFSFATGTPTLRAALASPPVPNIQLPMWVFNRTTVAMAAITIHQMMAMSNLAPPNSILVAKAAAQPPES